MRVDKFLKVCRIIKRRTVAKDACDSDKVLINGKQSKPSAKIKEGDIIEVFFGESSQKIEVIQLKEHVRKEEANTLYKVIN